MELDLLLLLVVILRANKATAQGFYCPGDTVQFSCRDTVLVKWQGSAFTGQCSSESDTIIFISNDLSQSDVGSNISCGVFTAFVESLTPSAVQGFNTAVISLNFTAEQSLNGKIIQCEDENIGDPLEVDVLLSIPATDITTPTLTADQISQSTVRVNFLVDDDRCVSTYHVNLTPTQDGVNSTSITSNSLSAVDVSGLDLCRYSYSVVGFTRAVGGDQSGLSVAVSFSVDLSAVNGVSNLRFNQENSALEWDQIANPLYPTCITGYLVTAQGWPYSTTVIATSVTREVLNSAGFPYCQFLRVNVTPITPVGLLTEGSRLLYFSLYHPDFLAPMLSHAFSLVSETVVLTVSVQGDLGILVPTRMYQYTNSSGDTSVPTAFTGNSFEIELPGVVDGQTVPVTVRFENNACTAITASNFTVPARTISNVVETEPSDTSFTVTLTLPLTAYQPSQLLIISSLNPPDVEPITADFTGHSMQHMVTFDGLTPGTDYTYIIRIVQRDVVPPATGAFSTMLPPKTSSFAPFTCGIGCIAGIVMAALVIVVIIIVVVVVIAAVKMHGNDCIRRGTDQSSSQSPTELRGPIYEEPKDFDPSTQQNTAYGHVQPLSSRH